METILGIDNGTQSTKVLIYDYSNKSVIATGQASHDLITKKDGSAEQKAQWWTEALKSALKQIPMEIKSTVKAIGVSGQQHGFVPLDNKGNVLTPVKLWCDTSTTEQCRELTEAFGGEEKLLENLGNPILPGYTLPKILWMKKYQAEQYKKLAKILLPHDYLNYWLTGQYTMEWGDASGTGFFDIRNRSWNREILQVTDPERDLFTLLPKLIQPYESSGYLTEKRAEELELPSGIPVSAGGGDNMMGAIGTATVKEGALTISLGTSGTLYGYSNTPVIDPLGNLAAFCSSTGGWLPLLCTMNCTVATELTRKLFDQEIKEFEEISQKAPAGSEGVITLPFYNGERVPNLPNGRGNIMGLTSENMTQPNLFRSAMESAIYGLKNGLQSFQNLGFDPQEIHLIGGGANSPFWSQMTADILELPVKHPRRKESAAFGAALQALWMLEYDQSCDISKITETHVTMEEKIYQPNKKLKPLYKAGFEGFMKYTESLSELYR